MNSIQAIEDAGRADGKVSIKLVRDLSPMLVELDKGSRDIVSFEITDNGVGFNDDNFAAFQTSDTTYKANRGGKGIGRFVWLVAFDSVSIRSTFKAGDYWKTRSFNFVARGDGVDSEETGQSSEGKQETIVKLLGFRDKFRSNAPRKAETIGAHIVEHCLEYLIRPNPPQLTLVDEATGEQIDLNEVFEKEMAANAKSTPFDAEGVHFNILHVKLYSTHIKDHLLHYCANNRVVKSEKLAGRIPDLAKRFTDVNGREFVYLPTSTRRFSTRALTRKERSSRSPWRKRAYSEVAQPGAKFGTRRLGRQKSILCHLLNRFENKKNSEYKPLWPAKARCTVRFSSTLEKTWPSWSRILTMTNWT